MHEVYFSHSYRDEQVNNYFIRLFEEQDIRLVADRQSKDWCVPKLERYLNYSRGFAAVVPRREADDAIHGISPYIGAELTMARRARLPRLIFAEASVFRGFNHITPDAPIPFLRETPQADISEHRSAISQFRKELDDAKTSRSSRVGLRKASVFVGPQSPDTELAALVVELLKQVNFVPDLIPFESFAGCVHDMSALDAILRSELSVHCLSPNPTPVDIALAQAHALCRPAFRLIHDASSEACRIDLQGLIRWPSWHALHPMLRDQLVSYQRGFYEVISLPTPTMRELVLEDWDPKQPLDLINHVQTGDPHLRQHVNAIRRRVGSFAQAVEERRQEDLCCAAYSEVRGCDWLYDFEAPNADYQKQRIRTPREMHADTAGTCLDFACLFAAILEAMQAGPVLLRFFTLRGAHAMAGYWTGRPKGQALVREKAAVLNAMRCGDLVVFETTGAARVGGVHPGGVACAGGFLDYPETVKAGRDFLERDDVFLDFMLDVQEARALAAQHR